MTQIKNAVGTMMLVVLLALLQACGSDGKKESRTEDAIENTGDAMSADANDAAEAREDIEKADHKAESEENEVRNKATFKRKRKNLGSKRPVNRKPSSILGPEQVKITKADSLKTLLRDFKESMEIASIAFSAPTSMSLNETQTITLLLNPSETAAQVKDQLEREIEATANDNSQAMQIDTATVKISRYMVADLTGQGFDIKDAPQERQLIDPEGKTEWKWDIKATDKGTHQLHLTLWAEIDLGGLNDRIQIKAFHKVITVKVGIIDSITEFVSKNKDMITLTFGSGVSLLGGYRLFQRWLRRKRSTKEEEEQKPKA